MGQGESDPGRPRMRVQVRRALAGEIGQEQQPLGAGRHVGGAVDEGEGVEADLPSRAASPGSTASRNQPSEPPADRITPMR